MRKPHRPETRRPKEQALYLLTLALRRPDDPYFVPADLRHLLVSDLRKAVTDAELTAPELVDLLAKAFDALAPRRLLKR
jgi:hypothetical protein